MDIGSEGAAWPRAAIGRDSTWRTPTKSAAVSSFTLLFLSLRFFISREKELWPKPDNYCHTLKAQPLHLTQHRAKEEREREKDLIMSVQWRVTGETEFTSSSLLLRLVIRKNRRLDDVPPVLFSFISRFFFFPFNSFLSFFLRWPLGLSLPPTLEAQHDIWPSFFSVPVAAGRKRHTYEQRAVVQGILHAIYQIVVVVVV